ncbi:FAD/NAD-P-binding domain-containing protein [Mycena vulgaris]|nr:FAD/NAD-P-binding domain-containing protein [Mycena vulgaris]
MTRFTLPILILINALLATGANSQWQAPFSSKETGAPWTVFHHPIKRVAVLGAGPAGLQAAAKLIEHNFTVRLFERAPSPGGNWYYTDETPAREPYPDKSRDDIAYIPAELPATHYYQDGEDGISLADRWREHWQPRPVWDNLHTNSPAVSTELPDVKYPPDAPWVLSTHTIQRHVRAYASVHNLNSNDHPTHSTAPSITSYSTRVEKIDKIEADQTWKLTLRKLQRLPESDEIKAHWWTEEFDAVVIATGPYAAVHIPEIEGIQEWSKVKLEDQFSIYHSQSYRRPERYFNKTILIVGASVSASEIARDIAPYAGKIIASIRPHDKERRFRSFFRFPNATEFVPEIERFEPLAEHDKGIKDGRIHLVNGTVLHGIDEIILATGFARSNIFFPNFTADGQPTDLHWTGHWIPDPTIAYTNVRPWTVGRYQSYAFAKVWAGTAHLPTQEQMREEYDRGQWKFRRLPAEALFRQYVAWLNNESLENGGRFVAPFPIEDREVVVYYTDAQWFKGSVTLESYTEFEKLPAREWDASTVAWEALVYDDTEW